MKAVDSIQSGWRVIGNRKYKRSKCNFAPAQPIHTPGCVEQLARYTHDGPIVTPTWCKMLVDVSGLWLGPWAQRFRASGGEFVDFLR